MSEYRTHTCNELREKDAGTEVRLSGFVKTVRDLGGCVFIDLRDHYGITQLTTEDPKLLEQIKEINVESTITVDGKVVLRPEENINDKIETGRVEVEIETITIQNNVLLPMPFEVEKFHEVKEDLRLQYRFLDLRSEKLKEISKKYVSSSNESGVATTKYVSVELDDQKILETYFFKGNF